MTTILISSTASAGNAQRGKPSRRLPTTIRFRAFDIDTGHLLWEHSFRRVVRLHP